MLFSAPVEPESDWKFARVEAAETGATSAMSREDKTLV
jgi:hypothetical protein